MRSVIRKWASAPVIALAGSLIVFAGLGLAGVPQFDWPHPMRYAVAVMFALTASARLNARSRADLAAMVPPRLPHPGLLVAVTGALELLGAVGLLWNPVAPVAASCLGALLVIMFWANVHAARTGAGLGRRPPTPLGIRTAQQVIFLVCALLAI